MARSILLILALPYTLRFSLFEQYWALCLSSLGCDHLASRNPTGSRCHETSTRPNTVQIGTSGVASANSLEPWGRTTMTTKSSKRSLGSNGLGGGTSRFLGLYLG